jgi:hypothetical protein
MINNENQTSQITPNDDMWEICINEKRYQFLE